MRTVTQLTNVLFLCIAIAGFGCCSAQRTKCETCFSFKGSTALTLPTLFQTFSQEQGISVLAEIPDESKQIDVSPGTYS